MRSRLLLAAAIGAMTAGCLPPRMTAAEIPLRDGRPNPEPVAGYRVICQSVPGPTDIFFASYYSGCQQVIEPYDRRVVVRAKG